MTPNIRLMLLAGMLVLSAAYAVLVEKDPSVASALALGYVAFILSVFLIISCWKKP